MRNSHPQSLFFDFSAALLLWMSMNVTAKAENAPIGVGPPPCQFQNLTEAITFAAREPGADSIVVTVTPAPLGFPSLVINDVDPLTIAAGAHACNSSSVEGIVDLIGDSTNIDRPVIKVVGNAALTLNRLRISKGTGARIGLFDHGGGVFHAGGGLLTLIDTVVTDNKSTFGSGIAVEGAGSLRLQASSALSNRRSINLSLRATSGIYVSSTGRVEVLGGSSLSSNDGSGIYVENAESVSIRNSTVIDNNHFGPSDPGGGLDIASTGNLVVDAVDILESRGIGIHVGSSVSNTISHTTVIGSSLSLGVNLVNTGATVLDTVYVGEHGRGGIRFQGVESLALVNCTVDGNGTGTNMDTTGGVHVTGGAQLTLDRTTIERNFSTSDGGGVFMAGNATAPFPILHLGANTHILQNEAGRGGGLFLSNVDFDATQAAGHRIALNKASSGGGLYILGGRARIGSGDPNGNIVDNEALNSGGGLFVEGADVTLFTTIDSAPVAVLRNRATDGLGGGIGISSYSQENTNSRVFAFDTRIEENSARSAGGGVLLGSSQGGSAVFCMGRSLEPNSCADLGGALPSGARSCASAKGCNTLKANKAQDQVFGGAAITRVSNGGPTPVRLSGVRISQNEGRAVIVSTAATPTGLAPAEPIELRDSQVSQNTVTSALIDGFADGSFGFPPNSSHLIGPVVIDRSTIANNSIGANYVISTRNNLSVNESIIFQPGITIHAGNQSGVIAHFVLANEVATLPARADLVIGDPLLLDVGNGDLHPGPGSPALDFSNFGSGGFDLDGVPRGQDDITVPNRFGPRDLGAFEQGAVLGRIFSNGFEGAP